MVKLDDEEVLLVVDVRHRPRRLHRLRHRRLVGRQAPAHLSIRTSRLHLSWCNLLKTSG